MKVYEGYGFKRVLEFTVEEAGDWPGMLLAMRLSELPESVGARRSGRWSRQIRRAATRSGAVGGAGRRWCRLSRS